MMVECSSISLEGSAELRRILDARGVELLSAPVSGNAKVIRRASSLSSSRAPRPHTTQRRLT